MKYHSQNNEAEIVFNYFKGRTGNVLEIGANDGITLSNSYDLIKSGWNGYLLEPGNVYADLIKLHGNNPDVKTFKVGIGEKNGHAKFFESGAHVKGGVDTGLVSSVYNHETQRWRNSGVEFTETEIQLMTFERFYQLAGKPTFDFISIDTEGLEIPILYQINLNNVGCNCICLEWNGDADLSSMFAYYCLQFGLKEIHRNRENIIFAL